MKNLSTIIDEVMGNKFSFLVAFFFVFTGTFAVLYAADFYPEPVTETAAKNVPAEVKEVVAKPVETVATTTETKTETSNIDTNSKALPETLTIDALNRTVTVLNPASNSVSALDSALLKGVVRHPDSANFTQSGNMFILGHSSYLPTVHNKNFQALNGVQNLKWGDIIRVSSSDTEYTYKVEKVYKAKASALTVPVAGKGKTLTLATCNSFGSIDDRYIVEATLQSTRTL